MSLPAQVRLTWDTWDTAGPDTHPPQRLLRELAGWSCHTTSVQQRALSVKDELRAHSNPLRLLPGDDEINPFCLCPFSPALSGPTCIHSKMFIRSFYDSWETRCTVQKDGKH